jgi:hypothetical protein
MSGAHRIENVAPWEFLPEYSESPPVPPRRHTLRASRARAIAHVYDHGELPAQTSSSNNNANIAPVEAEPGRRSGPQETGVLHFGEGDEPVERGPMEEEIQYPRANVPLST